MIFTSAHLGASSGSVPWYLRLAVSLAIAGSYFYQIIDSVRTAQGHPSGAGAARSVWIGDDFQRAASEWTQAKSRLAP